MVIPLDLVDGNDVFAPTLLAGGGLERLRQQLAIFVEVVSCSEALD